MSIPEKYHFSGWATRANIKCVDGRIIAPNAFQHQDGQRVPLVLQHGRNNVKNIVGSVYLEHRAGDVYCYGVFNDTPEAEPCKARVRSGDLSSLSIFATDLIEHGSMVARGEIGEVSLVTVGGNRGAKIDNVIQHGGDYLPLLDDEGVMLFYQPIEVKDYIEHADETIDLEKIWDTFNDDQKSLTLALIAQAVEDDDIEHSAEPNINHMDNILGGDKMKTNSFNNSSVKKSGQKTSRGFLEHGIAYAENPTSKITLSHSVLVDMVNDGVKRKSTLSAIANDWLEDNKALVIEHSGDNFIEHATTYGIENIEFLFPDARVIDNEPTFIKRKDDWVAAWLAGTRHVPWSRIKAFYADITEDEARAKGYIKGTQKKDEVFKLLKRETAPTTIYKKQRFDRDDLIDATMLDVLTFTKKEMRMVYNEEVARASLIGDGRDSANPDKIDEERIRPIWTDEDLFAVKVQTNASDDLITWMEKVIKARKLYKRSGNPNMYTSEDRLADLLLLRDNEKRLMFTGIEAVKTFLRVNEIWTLEQMEGLTRTVGEGADEKTYELEAIMVKPYDYTFGTDKGGELNFFEHFDINFNQKHYLYEGRQSGSLMYPFSALIIEHEVITPAGG